MRVQDLALSGEKGEEKKEHVNIILEVKAKLNNRINHFLHIFLKMYQRV